MELKYKVKNTKYKTINEVLKSEFNISTRLLAKLIRNKKIYKNGLLADTRDTIYLGDLITVDFNYEEDNSNIVPSDIKLDIIFEDEWLLVLNKPAGVAIHPSILHYDTSLSNGVKYYFDSINLKKKIRPVNRLDKNTSGIVVFAKCEYIQEQLAEQMANGIFKKQYLCVASGNFENKNGVINMPIARKSDSIIERVVDEVGQSAITEYEVLKDFNNYSLVLCTLVTGRTHQIRVHFSAIGHPLLGDSLYGTSSALISRQALHSYKTEFIHPITKEHLNFVAPIPNDIMKLCLLQL